MLLPAVSVTPVTVPIDINPVEVPSNIIFSFANEIRWSELEIIKSPALAFKLNAVDVISTLSDLICSEPPSTIIKLLAFPNTLKCPPPSINTPAPVVSLSLVIVPNDILLLAAIVDLPDIDNPSVAISNDVVFKSKAGVAPASYLK